MSTTRRYRILHAVGKGAFGTVYRASMLGEGGFQKEVAIKLMNENLEGAEEMARRQRDEARVLGLVRHRAILQVDGLVRLNGAWAVVMEFIDGSNLTEVLRVGPMPPRCAVEVAAEVAAALHVAYHATGPDGRELRLLHRDIKPSNVQLSDAGEVKLLDFGIARADFESREAETVDVIMGTLRYMAPERLDGLDTHAGDIYALGVTFVEMLTGRAFKKTSSNQARHAATCKLALDNLETALGAEAEPFRRLVLRMLAYSPDDRPTAAELKKELLLLADSLGGARLADWSFDRIAIVKERRREVLGNDELSGATLVEQTGSEMLRIGSEPVMVKPVTTERRLGPLLAGIAALSVVVLVLGTLVMRQLEPEPAPAPVPVVAAPVPKPEPVVAPEPAVAPSPEVVPAPSPVAPAARPAPVTRPVPVPAPVVEEPRPVVAPAGPPTGVVVLSGDATGVLLRGETGEFPSGKVPAGEYKVLADFGGGLVEQTMSVRVAAGATVRIDCTGAFQLCKVL